MTDDILKQANEIQIQMEKLQFVEENNFRITVDHWGDSIREKDLRPDVRAKIKQLFVDEFHHLETEFKEL